MIFVVPCLIILMGVVLTLIAKSNSELGEQHVVEVIDDSGIFAGKFHDIKNLKFITVGETITSEKKELYKNENMSALVIPKDYSKSGAVQIFSKNKPGFVLTGEIEKQMNDIATTDNMLKHHIDPAIVSAAKSNISLSPVEVTETGTKETNVGAAIGVGIACAILIYISLFIYGAQVMRGVIEEKTNRIIEVIISSVKPFQLMMGKIIGVGLVGLTQFGAWIALSFIVPKLLGIALSPSQGGIMGALVVLQTLHIGYLLFCFLFYFLTGYLLYSALFAAVGSAVDSETETQQFMFPITLPLLFTYILSVSVLFQAPDSPLAVWLSIIPITAPVAMMVRLPFGVPPWQLAISMSLMVIGFLFTTYVASKIYRVGVLMYGKKASYKELVKWFFYKE
jgi:ABC-2 type transport system permease protein